MSPTTKAEYGRLADAPDQEVLDKKLFGKLLEGLFAELRAQGFDFANYDDAHEKYRVLVPKSAAATRKEQTARYVAEKRKVLLALAGTHTKKVAKGLNAAQADNTKDLQQNKEQADDLAVAETAQAAAPAALQRAKARNRAELNMLQQQGQGLQDLPKHVGQFAMALATLGGAAPAPAEDDGDTQTPSPEQLPTPTPVPATTDAQPTLADRNLGGISLPLEPQKKKKQKVALSSPEQAPAHLKVL